MTEGCECDRKECVRKDASLVEGGEPNTGCGLKYKHGCWMGVDECGRVDEVVVVDCRSRVE